LTPIKINKFPGLAVVSKMTNLITIIITTLFSISTVYAYEVPLIDQPINIDGVIDEAVWERALVINDFRTIKPNNQLPHEFKTEIRILASTEGLYFANVNNQPVETLIAQSASRDVAPSADDILIVLDTSGEGKYGFHFQTSLGNSIADGLLQPERNFEYAWDGAFLSQAIATESGWNAEFFIPWNILRMPENGKQQKIAMYFHRTISHLNQVVAWPAIPLSDQAYISALTKVNIPKVEHQNNIVIAPYASVNYDQIEDSLDSKIGVDLFWKPSANWQIASTFNPDFGQVENDTIVVNFSANETFLPEKRPFFVENKNIFEIPGAPTLVYTRRIGANQSDPDIDPERVIAASNSTPDIINATKVIGEKGAIRYGFMAAVEDKATFVLDNGENLKLDGSEFYATRILYEDITSNNNRWGIGYFGTVTEHYDRDAKVNQIDALFRSDNGRFLFDGQFLTSNTEQGTGYGSRLMFTYTDNFGLLHRFRTHSFDKKLEINDAGYLFRNNVEQYFYRIKHMNEDSDSFQTLNHELRVFYRRNKDGFWLDSNLWYVGNITFNNLHSLDWVAGVDRDDYEDDLADEGQIFKTKNTPAIRVTYATDRSKSLVHEYSLRYFQEDLGGDGYHVNAKYIWSPESDFYITSDIFYQFSNDRIIHDEDNRFNGYQSETIDIGVNGTWIISDKQELRLGVQWLAVSNKGESSYRTNADHELVVTNEDPLSTSFSFTDFIFQLRYKYEFAPLSELYIVYGQAGDYELDEQQYPNSTYRLLDKSLANTNTKNLVIKVRFRF